MAEWREGSFRDMGAESTAATMSVISEALFGGDARLTSQASMDNITAALEGFSEARVQALLGLPIIPLSPRGLKAHRGQAFLRRTLETVVRERLSDGADDFLGQVVRALHERFPPDQALRLSVDNAATFYLAGHETTANAVTWTLFLLSEQPSFRSGCRKRRGRRSAAIRAASPNGCPCSVPVLQESMRLYPPVPRFDRQAVAADRLGEWDVLPGDIVSIWPWLLHRNTSLWEEPDAFGRSVSPMTPRNPIVSSIFPSEAGRGCASARASRPRKRWRSFRNGLQPGASNPRPAGSSAPPAW
jgi:cytochrome P450